MGASPLPPGTGMAAGFTAGFVLGVISAPIILLALPLIAIATPGPP